LISGVTGIAALLSIFGVSTLTGPLILVDAALAAFLGVMIRRMSRAAAVVMLVLFVIERIFGGIAHGINAGIGGLALLLLSGFISAVRGTFAYQRYLLAAGDRNAPA